MVRIGQYSKALAIVIGLSAYASASFFPGPIQVNNAAGTPTSVGYANGNSSVPVNVINTPAVTQSGTWGTQVTNWVSTVTATQAGSYTVTQGTGNFVMSVTTITHNGVAQPIYGVSSFVVTPGTGNFVMSVTTVSQSGSWSVSPGTGVYVTNVVNTPGVTQSGTWGVQVTNLISTTSITNGTTVYTALGGSAIPAFSASTTTFSMATSSGDIAGICGNATNTVLVYGLRVSCTQTTAGIIPISIAKRSTAYTATWSTMTVVPQDSNYTGAISTAVYFTTLPHTDGTLVGYLDTYQLGCMAAATASPSDIYIQPSEWRIRPIALRGVSQCIGVNPQSASITGNKWTVSFSWLETSSTLP